MAEPRRLRQGELRPATVGAPSPELRDARRRDQVIAIVALALAVVMWLLRWRGVDYPAQVYRVDLVRRDGLSLWNANWYGGHYTPGYGVAFPWLASVLGLAIPAIASTVGCVVLFTRLLRDTRLPHVATGACIFALLMLVNLYEGRLAFALGLFFGLLAVYVARRRRWRVAAVMTGLATLSSPVAGAFTALAFAAWALSLPHSGTRARLTHPASILCAVAAVTTLAISVSFPEGGWFPFGVGAFVLLLVGAVAVRRLVPPSLAAVRLGGLLTIAAAVPVFAIPNPLGGNLTRLAIVGVPILWAAPRRRTAASLVICLVLTGWQARPLLHLSHGVNDPSATASYFKPLVAEIEQRADGPVRLEIPFTADHWEAAFVAPDIPLARGWERQLDLRYNRVLYADSLDLTSYRRWLLHNGISFVAVPDVELEAEAQREAALVAQAPYLQRIWRSDHWQLFRVVGSRGLISGGADLLELSADRVRLDVHEPGAILLRMRYNAHLVVEGQTGCARQGRSGWTVIDAAQRGPITLTTQLLPADEEDCPAPQ